MNTVKCTVKIGAVPENKIRVGWGRLSNYSSALYKTRYRYIGYQINYYVFMPFCKM
jgi:hypothetical protein